MHCALSQIYLVSNSGVRSGHASHALHEQIFRNCMKNFLRDEVDIVEFGEKHHLFRMKSEADPRRRPIFLCYFREYREFRTKSKKSETG